MIDVALVDLGVGNLGSLRPLLADLGLVVRRHGRVEDLCDAAVVVLPGVGSATTAAEVVGDERIRSALVERHERARPVIGICLGAQLLCDHLAESGTPGLGVLPGKVERHDGGRPVNVGWRRLDPDALDALGLADGLADDDHVYLNHGFRLPTEPGPDVVWTVGDDPVPAVVRLGSTVGLQFHPETSQQVGRRLMSNLLGVLDVR